MSGPPRALVLLPLETVEGAACVALARRILPDRGVDVRVLVEATASGAERWQALVDGMDRAERMARGLLTRARDIPSAEGVGPDGPPGASPPSRLGDAEAVLDLDALVGTLEERALVVVDPALPRSVVEQVVRADVPVAWPVGVPDRPIRAAALPYRVSPRSLLAPLAWLRSHLGTIESLVAVGLDGVGIDLDAPLAQELLGLPVPLADAQVELDLFDVEGLRDHLAATGCDLVVLAAPRGPELWPFLVLVQEAPLPCPVLLVPSQGALEALRPRLQVTDLLRTGESALGGIVRVDPLGRSAVVDEEEVTLVVEGEARGRVRIHHGRIRVPAEAKTIVGIAEGDGDPTRDLQSAGRILDGEGAPVRLLVAGEAPPPEAGVRMWAARFGQLGPPPPESSRGGGIDGLIDGDALVDTDLRDDVPSAAGPALLRRLASRLVEIGVPVEGLPAEEPPSGADTSLGVRLRVRAGARPVGVDVLALLLDNESARRSLIERIDGAERSVWLQTFMFEQDEVGELITDALRRAAERGVEVRLLVDAVFAGHGALGRTNPLLVPLADHATAEVRAARAVDALADLRRRDHRKALVIDGTVARISGRNVGAPYFRGFGEVALTPETEVRAVPWLDASVDVGGGVVRAVAESFSEAWERAGGEVLSREGLPDLEDGGMTGHFVVHETLEDAHTLETYRLLFESAERRIMLVNTFPLQFELQRVLLDALRRGVEVRFLVGTVRPQWGDGVPFPGEAYRELAQQVVHGRLDPLVEAGADVRPLMLPGRAGWDARVTRLFPHVHAKLLTVDGEVATLGSANLDVAASYWDSEALLVVEDATFTGALDAELDALFEASPRRDPNDPAWQEAAAARRAISLNWPGWAT